MKIAILGGGLSGLELCRRLSEKGIDSIVLEGRETVGGLCRSIAHGQYRWDLGPHAFYSRHPDAMSYYHSMPFDYYEWQRRVRVSHVGPGGREIELNYPFENGLSDLPMAQRMECVAGYLRAALCGDHRFKNLEHWIENGLGTGIGRYFMTPYNEKIWSAPLNEISMGLVKGKIEPEPIWKILRNAFIPGTVGRAYQARFIYPKVGGAGAIPNAILSEIKNRVRTSWQVSRLVPAGSQWRVVNIEGKEEIADKIVSTIPLPALVRSINNPELNGYAGAFRSNDTFFVGIGLKQGRRLRRYEKNHWTFFAGPQPYYRMTTMSALAPHLEPTILAEITRKGVWKNKSPSEAVSAVMSDLIARGVIDDEGDVAVAQAHIETNTYPIQTLGMPEAREKIEAVLNARNIYLLGRNGRWEYINTDGVFIGVANFLKRHAASWSNGMR